MCINGKEIRTLTQLLEITASDKRNVVEICLDGSLQRWLFSINEKVLANQLNAIVESSASSSDENFANKVIETICGVCNLHSIEEENNSHHSDDSDSQSSDYTWLDWYLTYDTY